MEQIDFLTITSILLDNAIESAAEGGIAVCFLEDTEWNKLVMIVKKFYFRKRDRIERYIQA